MTEPKPDYAYTHGTPGPDNPIPTVMPNPCIIGYNVSHAQTACLDCIDKQARIEELEAALINIRHELLEVNNQTVWDAVVHATKIINRALGK